MKFLIIGGLGFLGCNLASRVLLRNENLLILDNFSRNYCKNNLDWLKKQGNLKIYKEDIRNSKKLNHIIKKVQPDVIFHTAGQVAVTHSLNDPKNDFEINVIGTFNILEAIRKYSPSSLMFFSSTNKVYGDLGYLKCLEGDTRYYLDESFNSLNENFKLDFQTPYGCSKGAADQYVLDYARTFNLHLTVFRHSAIYGPRQFPTFDQGWVSWFCLKALELKLNRLNQEIVVLGNGKQVRDIIYIEDVIDLYFQSINQMRYIEGQPINIGGGIQNSISILEMIEYLEQELNISIPYKKDKERKSDQKYFVSDNKKVENLIGWRPNVSKLQGLKKLLQWLKSNLIKEI